ncbi:hypothetical protein Fot_15134 [Forsythia ovata]|uniref:Uncharacterized protein n=1 Tax=Forsythia ovata TaxID=205694 RepID=A0ABD1W8L1_9LAMI
MEYVSSEKFGRVKLAMEVTGVYIGPESKTLRKDDLGNVLGDDSFYESSFLEDIADFPFAQTEKSMKSLEKIAERAAGIGDLNKRKGDTQNSTNQTLQPYLTNSTNSNA